MKKIKFLKNFFTNKILYNRIQLAVFWNFNRLIRKLNVKKCLKFGQF